MNPNQFSQSVVKGLLDLRHNSQTLSVRVNSGSADLVAGQAVKLVDAAGALPEVTAATADEDDIFGFVNYNNKSNTHGAGDMIEISFFRGNVMYMEASAAIARGASVMIVVTGNKVATATATNRVIGRALDKAAADGDLIRVIIDLPGALAS